MLKRSLFLPSVLSLNMEGKLTFLLRALPKLLKRRTAKEIMVQDITKLKSAAGKGHIDGSFFSRNYFSTWFFLTMHLAIIC